MDTHFAYRKLIADGKDWGDAPWFLRPLAALRKMMPRQGPKSQTA